MSEGRHGIFKCLGPEFSLLEWRISQKLLGQGNTCHDKDYSGAPPEKKSEAWVRRFSEASSAAGRPLHADGKFGIMYRNML